MVQCSVFRVKGSWFRVNRGLGSDQIFFSRNIRIGLRFRVQGLGFGVNQGRDIDVVLLVRNIRIRFVAVPGNIRIRFVPRNIRVSFVPRDIRICFVPIIRRLRLVLADIAPCSRDRINSFTETLL